MEREKKMGKRSTLAWTMMGRQAAAAGGRWQCIRRRPVEADRFAFVESAIPCSIQAPRCGGRSAAFVAAACGRCMPIHHHSSTYTYASSTGWPHRKGSRTRHTSKFMESCCLNLRFFSQIMLEYFLKCNLYYWTHIHKQTARPCSFTNDFLWILHRFNKL
jgi:hypothetical protein